MCCHGASSCVIGRHSWTSSNKIASFDDLDGAAGALGASLSCIYLEVRWLVRNMIRRGRHTLTREGSLRNSQSNGRIDRPRLAPEHNPLASEYEYRQRIAKLFPAVTQIDATMVRQCVGGWVPQRYLLAHPA